MDGRARAPTFTVNVTSAKAEKQQCHRHHCRRCHDSSRILLDYFSLNISIDNIKVPYVIRNEMPVSFVLSLLAALSVRRYIGTGPYGRIGETKA